MKLKKQCIRVHPRRWEKLLAGKLGIVQLLGDGKALAVNYQTGYPQVMTRCWSISGNATQNRALEEH